jgi:hypothetical protein
VGERAECLPKAGAKCYPARDAVEIDPKRSGEKKRMLTITVDGRTDQLGSKLEGQSQTDLATISSRNILRLASLIARFVGRPRKVRSKPALAIFLLLLAPALANAMDLKRETLQAWDAYVRTAKMRMEERARGQRSFLWVDEKQDLLRRVRGGEVVVEPVDSGSPSTVPRGLIHDWIGAVFVRKAQLDDVMGVLDDYERYKDIYRPMVVKARVLEQTHDHEKVTLLMLQKAYSVTAAVETDNEIHIARLDADRAYSLSTSVRVQEIADYGQPSEHALPVDHGPGYVWRTFTVTRAEQRDDGVYVEMELMGLSRGIPLAFRWLIQPLAERLPRSLLLAMLNDTRGAVSQKIKAAR